MITPHTPVASALPLSPSFFSLRMNNYSLWGAAAALASSDFSWGDKRRGGLSKIALRREKEREREKEKKRGKGNRGCESVNSHTHTLNNGSARNVVIIRGLSSVRTHYTTRPLLSQKGAKPPTFSSLLSLC